MNSAEIEEIRPGNLFTLWSAHKQGITVATLSKERWRLIRIEDGDVILLTKLPGAHSFSEKDWRDALAVSEDVPAIDTYEFLYGDRFVYLEKPQLAQLEQEY